MLWLCLFAARLPLEAAAHHEAAAPLAISERIGNRLLILEANETARAGGVVPGLNLTEARVRCPELLVVPRNRRTEHQALQTLALWGYQFGRPVVLDTEASCAYVEIQRSLRLFGGWRALRDRIQERSTELPLAVRFGVAPTLGSARLLAIQGIGLQRPIARAERIATALSGMPLDVLPLKADDQATLQRAGMRSIGEWLSLPADNLLRRFGRESVLYRQRLLGEAPDVWESFEPPERYRRRIEFLQGVDSSEALLFPLRGMMSEFVLYLKARHVAVQRFELNFRDLGRRHHRLRIQLSQATHDAERLMLVLRERLQHLATEEAVDEIVLLAEHFHETESGQRDLFDTGESRLQQAETVTERLIARLGEDAIRRLEAVPGHRPECAWRQSGSKGNAIQPIEHPPRPVWLLPRPHPVQVSRLLSPPERIETAWWDRAVARDYYLAEDARGRKLWVFRQPGDRQWYLHGLWQ